MAALDFPDNPAVGDLYGSASTVWRWDGAAWSSTAGVSGQRGRVAFAQVAANQSLPSNILTDIGGLSVTFNVVAGRTYRLSAHVFCTSVTGQVVATIRTPAGSVMATHVVQTNANGDTLNPVGIYTPPGTGSVTAKVAVIDQGGGNLFADANDPAYILIEDITYEAGSTTGGGAVGTGLEAAKPTAPNAGTRYFATDTKRDWLYDGTGWIIMSEPSQPFTFTITQGVNITFTQTVEPAWFQRSNGVVDARLSPYITGAGNAGWGVTIAASGLPAAPDRSNAGTFMYYDAGVLLHHGIAGWTPSNGNIPLLTQGQTGGWPTGYTTAMSNGDGLEINLRYRMTSKYS